MPSAVPDSLPTVLVPGLNCSARLYAEQIPALWRFGPVTVADHTRDDTMAAIASRILTTAPPRFALAGLSMGRLHRPRDRAASATAGGQSGVARHGVLRRDRGADRAPPAFH